ncbi:hypothetical protein MYX82_09990 [Acidobacteria bacterium AH-259-D05]|nr:hypothetical protein [Acidobacteria bacterium AH-259-D05]
MGPEKLVFLRLYLELHPELKSQLRTDPPAVRSLKGWEFIRAFRFLKSGIELTLASGKPLRIVPKKGRIALRDRFQVGFLDLLRHHFPAWKVLRVLTGTDRNRHQTAALLRLLLWTGRRHLAGLVIYPGESPEASERILTSIILWWHELQAVGRAERILVFIPECWSEHLLNTFPSLKIPLVCYKYRLRKQLRGGCPVQSQLQKIYPRSVNSSELRRPYVIFPYQQEVPALLREMKQRHPHCLLSFRQGRWELSYLGLRIAWYDETEDRCLFDLLNPRVLSSSTRGVFEEHLRQIAQLRCFPPECPPHPYYRLAQERWLESMLISDLSILKADLADTFYSQVPTYLDGERKVLDLLTVTKGGRVVILELKVEKDLDLVFQALDYWKRVWHHLKRGDFQRSGYFPAMTLLDEPPLLYLISPLFEFHKVMSVFRKYLKEEIVLTCIGINSDWRRGLRLLRRFQF